MTIPTLVELCSASPPRRSSAQPNALSHVERHQLIIEWNRTRKPYRRDACFHQLFEEQAARSPERIAASYYGETLTYQELNERASSWAGELQRLGVAPDTLVGVCLEPSLHLLIALLSILKAGGAYVPLDPNYPAKRLAFMLEDAGLGLVLTSAKARSVLPRTSARLLPVETLDANVLTTARPELKPTAENLAYVIYTSGSTGRPKGTMITHRGLVNYLTWAVDSYQMHRGTGAPVYSSVSFDLTVTALFAPLLTGGCVTFLSSKDAVEGLSDLLKRKPEFSVVKITPAHLDLLRSRLANYDLARSTNMFVIGGEALTSESLRFWQKNAPQITLVNEYGPTETVVGCCVYFVPIGQKGAQSVPIGRPIANTQLYVLDAALEPVPIGVSGELFIGGDGVARGYLNRPELTAERFIPNPFCAEDPHASPTLYRTGDLARYRPDGNLEFLGRIDHQVKVHGYRIETGELEAVLVTHPDVRGAVVSAREVPGGDRYLVAYLAVRDAAGLCDADLRTWLKQHVPDYMVPAMFVMMAELPLTSNGKVDREALPDPEGESKSSTPSHESNATQYLVELWEKLLEHPGVSLDDNFFEMGGNSLLAVRLIIEINRIFKRKLHSLVLYENPTIRQLAAAIEEGPAEWREPELMPMHRGRKGRAVFVLHVSSEMFSLISKLRDRPESFQVSHMTWDPETVQASSRRQMHRLPTLTQIAAPHTARILKSGLSGPCLLAGFSFGGPLAFEVAHQLRKNGVAVDGVILLDADLRIPGFERFKLWGRRVLLKVASHSRNTMRNGIGYLGRKAKERHLRKREERDAIAAAWENPIVLDAKDQVVPWEVVRRIWVHALNQYQPKRLPSRGFLIRAEQSSYTHGEDYDGCLGWRGLFSEGLSMVTVPGDHYSMWRPPHSDVLTQELIDALDSLGPVPEE